MSARGAAALRAELVRVLGEGEAAGRGEIAFHCPECPDKPKRTLYINASKGVVVCYRCGLAGRLSRLAKRLGIAVDADGTLDLQPGPDAAVTAAQRKAQGVAALALAQSLRYLGPGIDAALEPAAAMAWDYVTRVRGVNPLTAQRARVAVSSDPYFAGYVVFPVYDDLRGSKLVHASGRTYCGLQPPQKNQRTGVLPLSRGDCVYGLERARMLGWAVVCEAPLDALRVSPFACATYGIGVSARQIEALRLAGLRRVVWYYDREVPAQRAAWDAALAMSSALPGGAWVAVPPGKDPGECDERANAAALARAIRVTTETHAQAQAWLSAGVVPTG